MAEILSKEQLRAKAESLTLEFNKTVQSGDFNTSAKLNTEIEKVIGDYTATARKECFAVLKATEDPMLAAVRQLTYQTIRKKDAEVGESKVPVRTIEDADRYIDLLKLHKEVEGGIGKDKKWAYMIEQFNCLLTAQKAQDLGIDPKAINDSYAMSKIASEINLGKTPTSKTNILRTLQTIVNAMIGEEYKAVSHDVNFLMEVYSKKSRKALTISTANHSSLRQYLMEICHRIVTNGRYDIDYKKKSTK